MSKLFVLSHVADRFRSDFFPCGTHVRQDACPSCNANLNDWSAPLLYWWEYEFGDPRSSLAAAHNCFWGDFRLMVDPIGKSILSALNFPCSFHATVMTEGEGLFNGQALLEHATLDVTVNADAVECNNTICESCGVFSERRRQLTRLRIPAANIPHFGIFTIKQNGKHGPMFVTEDARVKLEKTNITGIGYYPAGRVI